MSDYLIEVKNLTKRFPIKGGLFGKEVGAVRPSTIFHLRSKKGRL